MVHNSLVEVTAEKLQALLQCLARVEARGWGTGRVPKDYFDLWYLLKDQDFPGGELTELVPIQCCMGYDLRYTYQALSLPT
jgi:hypothetical protein